MRFAAEAADLKVAIARVQGIGESWRRLRRSPVTKHPLVPSLARETVGCLRASRARSAEALMDAPEIVCRDLVVIP
jgi:hypothetical protein